MSLSDLLAQSPQGAPLSGYLVLEVADLLPGPFAGMVLRQLGATVIKIERPGTGDPMRSLNPGAFELVNTGKHSLTLDLKSHEGQGVLLRLSEKADALITGFRPGVADRLGFGRETLRNHAPRLIYAALSGYGQTGPYKMEPGHDLNYQAMTGALYLSGDPDGPPDFTSAIPVADLSGAMFTALSIVAGLLRRENRSSEGEFLDIAIADCLMSWTGPRIAQYLAANSGQALDVRDRDIRYRAAYGVFRTRDGRFLSIGAVEDAFWLRLVDFLGLDEWRGAEFSSSTARRAHSDAINASIQRRLGERDLDDWMSAFSVLDLPVRPVETVADLHRNPQLQARQILQTQPGVHVPYPVAMDGIDRCPPRPIGPPGTANKRIFSLLGFSEAVWHDFAERRVV